MGEERDVVESSVSIWHRNLNFVFVCVVILLAGIAVVFAMVNIINNKVEEINNSMYGAQPYNNSIRN